jgi:DNA invertase Pin-like site-specific DNA recombinase
MYGCSSLETLQGNRMERLVAYYRVSTQRQGESGLGLEAQQAAAAAHARANGEIVAEFTEIESGKVANRPQLQAAIAACSEHGATLVVAKLDRLSRNVAFTASLKESGVRFVACDNPNASELTIDILAAVAADEARRISHRTRDALAALKARGARLGSPIAAATAVIAGRVNVAKAAEHAETVRPLAIRKRAAGKTLQEIADYLSNKGLLTRRGHRWTAAGVMRLLA